MLHVPASLRRPAIAVALVATAAAAVLAQSATAPAPASDVVRPGETLVVDGIPPVATSIKAEVSRYTEARSAGLADWHPTRREMLVGTRFANTTQVHHVAMPGGARRQLTFFDEPVGGATFEPAGGRYFVFPRDAGGNEFSQLYRYDVADGSITLLTDGKRSQNGNLVFSARGDRATYTSTRRNGADRDIYVIDPANPGSDRLLLERKGGGWGVTDWSPDDTRIAVIEYVSVTKSNLYVVDVATGQATPATPPEASVAYGGAAFSADGRGLFVTSDEGSEFQRLAYLDLSTRKATPLVTDLPMDVDEFELAHDRRTIAFTTNDAGISRLYFYDVASRRHRAVDGVPVGVIGGIRWHRNSRELGFTMSSARSASDVYSVTLDGGAAVRWTESELGGIVPSQLSEPELIRWKSFDGREISGFYYRPPTRFQGRRPVIIDIHGGPEGQSRPGFLGRSNYFLNELGVARIYPNVRGSVGYGKTFVGLDNGMKREDSVRDIGALLDWIATRPDLDPARVMVTGGSYGGYMTLAVATMYDDRIRCALDVVGISHFGTFLKNTESYRRDLRRVEYGDERDPEMAAFFDRIAPLNRADRITKPLFVVQGGNDPRVPLSEAEQMVARVRKNGSPVWYLMARDEGHGFRKKSNVDYQFYATVLFVRQFLLDDGARTSSSR